MPFSFNPFTGNFDYYQAATGGTGDVVGPASATDNAIARFDLTTGKLIQNSGIVIDDSNNMSLANSIAIGAVVDLMTVNGSAINSRLAIDTNANSIIELHSHTNSSTDTNIVYGAKSRGTQAAPTIVSSGDLLFGLLGVGYDGTDFATSSEIRFTVDGTPGNNDMPGKIAFFTSPDGSQTLTERMSINAAGNVTVTGNLLATTNQAQDLGAKTTRFRSLNASGLNLLYRETGPTVSLLHTAGTDVANYEMTSLGTAGTQNFNLNNGTLFTTTIGYGYTDSSGAITTLNNRSNGTIVIGGSSVFGATNACTADVDTDGGAGSTIIGAAYVNGSPLAPSTASIACTGLSAVVIGSAGSNDFLGTSGGNSTSIVNGGAGSSIFGAVNISEGDTCTASMSIGANGSMIQGYVEIANPLSAGQTASISTSGTGGSLARGFCSRGSIESTNQGTFASGFVGGLNAVNTTALRASGIASIVLGRVINSGSIISSGNASFVSGNSNGSGTFTGSGAGSASFFNTTSSVTSSNTGAGSLFVANFTSAGAANLTGAGSAIIGRATSSGTITVSATGAHFFGEATSTGSVSVTTGGGNFGLGSAQTGGISATGSLNCGQIGIGANSIASSTRFGEAIRLLHLTSVATATNGDVALDSSGIVQVHSNSIRRNIQKLYQNTNFSVTTVGNVGTGVDDLTSHTLAASSLTVDGDYSRHSGFGTFAANANLKQVRVLWNGTEVVTTGAAVINGGTWESMVTIVRVSSTNARAYGRITVKDGAGVITTYYGAPALIATTWTGTVIAKHTGEATSNDDITQVTGHLDIVRVS
jgi:hypothetical protein